MKLHSPWRVLGTLVSLCALGCGTQDLSLTDPGEPPSGAPFLVVDREPDAQTVQGLSRALGGSAGELVGASPTTFYVAIKKSELGKKWLFAGHLTQYSATGGVPPSLSLGTRVVTFQVQNGKLYALDADGRGRASETFDPTVVVEAYPIITGYRHFESRPHAADYVLFDPGAGRNRFMVLGDLFSGSRVTYTLELGMLSNFRQLASGFSWDLLFTGYADKPIHEPNDWDMTDNVFRSSGTFRLTLRPYFESAGFTPLAMSELEQPWYFQSPGQRVFNGSGTEAFAQKWAIRKGMKPITILVSPEVKRQQLEDAYQAYDLYGAAKQGIELWNQAFGFKVFEVKEAAGFDGHGDDDKNVLVWDRDNALWNAFAFADLRSNPITGEVRGANVYFNSALVDYAMEVFDPPAMPTSLPEPSEAAAKKRVGMSQRRRVPTVGLATLESNRVCGLSVADLRWRSRARRASATPAGQPTGPRNVERFVAAVIAHEIGHVLGLRHNFAASTATPGPSSSVMDYLTDEDTVAMTGLGTYDVAAVQYLYGLTATPPSAGPFCTDEDVYGSDTCAPFDATPDPTADAAAHFQAKVAAYLNDPDPGAMLEPSTYWALFQLTDLIHTPADTKVHQAAWEGLIKPLRPAPTAPATFPSRHDALTAMVLGSVPYPEEWAEWLPPTFSFPKDDPAFVSKFVADLKAILVTSDAQRSYGTRRLAVPALRYVQSIEGYRALAEARPAIAAEAATKTGDAKLMAEDLLRQVDRAMSPYFD